MNNAILNDFAGTLAHRSEMTNLGMEGFSTFTAYLSDWANKLGNASNSLLVGLTHPKTATKIPNKLLGILDKVEAKSINPITVYIPNHFSNHITPYANYLTGVVTALADIDTRLLLPVTDYLNTVMSDDGSRINAPWIATDMAYQNVDKYIKQLGKFFTGARINNNDSSMTRFDAAYISTADYKRAGETVKALEDAVKGINLVRLRESEGKLYTAVNLYVKLAREDDSIITTNKQNLRKLIASLNAISAEIELLASVVYMQMVLSTVMSDTSDKLIKNLK